MKKKANIDRGFLEQALTVLRRHGTSACEFLRENPDRSKKQLAEMLGTGVTSRGLTMALFTEARQQSKVRELVRELLYRKILQEFPDGWRSEDNIRPTVKLGSWHYDVVEFAPECEETATTILKALATNDKPERGWKPQSPEDERLRHLFETYWNVRE